MTQDSALALKNGMRRLASGVSILAARGLDGASFAMTVSSVTSVSIDPPSLLVCVNCETSICPVLSPGTAFTINVLAQRHREVSIVCASGIQGEERFETGHWLRPEGRAPQLADAEAAFYCTVGKIMTYGTHNIIVGEIAEVQTAESAPDPLIYLDGGYRQLQL